MPVSDIRTFPHPSKSATTIAFDYTQEIFSTVCDGVLKEIVQTIADKFVEIHGQELLGSIDKQLLNQLIQNAVETQLQTDINNVISEVASLRRKIR